jgi:hypothetical protein
VKKKRGNFFLVFGDGGLGVQLNKRELCINV